MVTHLLIVSGHLYANEEGFLNERLDPFIYSISCIMKHAASGVMAAQILKYVDSSTNIIAMKTKSYNYPSGHDLKHLPYVSKVGKIDRKMVLVSSLFKYFVLTVL